MISIDETALSNLIRQIVQDELTRITPRPERLDAEVVAHRYGC